MTELAGMHTFGELIEPATLKIERILPGSAERVWSYLTDGELRRKWLAAGTMQMNAGTPFELVWRNDELTDPPGKRPDAFPEEQRMQSRIIEVDPPRRLVFSWGERGEVSFTLEPKGSEVLLTVIHRRISDRTNEIMIGAGWHMHLEVLAAVLSGGRSEPFWDGWARLCREYERRLPG
ncbi:SRPBCC family protein [Rhizobium cremeum]|uniref:SRPBCC family protein n=1 Tax=Rhizobium cremeum TaxID=2813827 RepID=UPI000DDD8988|nr:SRPBCC family protein [Rhizobium cremeum]MCJ7996612.1 SRPBCC family protein [Rhizobium cremeum]MCJ7999336.1 SRPBCC family protein [Rhizobium cremeum]